MFCFVCFVLFCCFVGWLGVGCNNTNIQPCCYAVFYWHFDSAVCAVVATFFPLLGNMDAPDAGGSKSLIQLRFNAIMTDDEIYGMFNDTRAHAKQLVEGGDTEVLIIPTVHGYDYDDRELWMIPDAKALCKQAIRLGLYGLLMVPAEYGAQTLGDKLDDEDLRNAWICFAAIAHGDNGQIAPDKFLKVMAVSVSMYNQWQDSITAVPSASAARQDAREDKATKLQAEVNTINKRAADFEALYTRLLMTEFPDGLEGEGSPLDAKA